MEGNNPVTTTRVICPKNLTSCTLVLNVSEVVCENSTLFWQINEDVDGVSVQNSAWQPWYQYQQGNGCMLGNWAANYSVAPGIHKVQLVTYAYGAQTGETQGPWNVNYMVTTP